jgi:hypothetical protein
MAITYHAGRRIQGTSTESNPYKVHTFTSTGNTNFVVTGSGDVEYLVIAGGGGGGGGKNGNSAGAGGGAGGFRTNVSGATSGGGSSAEATYGVTAQTYTITVGAKGSGGAGGYGTGAGGYVGDNGSNSSIVPTSGTSIISIGGGGGAGANGTAGTIQAAGVGGSGGGAGGYSDGTYTPPYGVGTANQGYNGGNSNTSGNEITGGGGGSGAVGQTPTGSIGGNGGNGTASSIQTGTAITYAGGGGGSVYQGGYGTGSGSGGTGGGGAGAYGSGWIAGANATVYGSGGGGANNTGGWAGTAQAGGNGSDGIVIIRYKTNSGITATGGTITTIDVTSTVTKPTDVQAGSRFEETDTRKMYSFESALEFDDDFSSNSGWTYVGTVSYNSSGYQNLTFTRNGNNNGCYYNLGTVSDTSWMLRAKLHLTTKSTSSQSSFIGLTSITGGSNSAQDAIGMFFITVNNTLFSVDSDGQTIAAGANSSNSFTTTNGNDYWIQITRLTATTMRVEIFDNANYTGTASITINDTIPSSIQSTNYLKLQNREELSNNGSSDNWTCDDVKFYNGVTSVSNTWKEIGT